MSVTLDKKYGLYLVVLLAATGFFLYQQFPAQTLEDYAASRIHRIMPGVEVKLGKAGMILPPGIKLVDVEMFRSGNLLFHADKLKLRPELLSFFGDTRTVNFRGTVAQGTAEGSLASSSQMRLSVETDLKGIRLEDIPAVYDLARREIKGRLTGQITFQSRNGNLFQGTGKAGLHLLDGTVQLLFPILNMDSLDFRTIDADITLQTGGRIRIADCRFNGNQMEGSVAGTLMLAQPLEKSRLDLKGTVKPYPVLAANIRKMFPVNSLFGKQSGGIPFRIEGTLGSPQLALR